MMESNERIKLWVGFLRSLGVMRLDQENKWGVMEGVLNPHELPSVARRVYELRLAVGAAVQSGDGSGAGGCAVALSVPGVVMGRGWWFAIGDLVTVYTWPGNVIQEAGFEWEGLTEEGYDLYYSDRLDLYWADRDGDDIDLSSVDGWEDGEEVSWQKVGGIPKGARVIGGTGWVPSKRNEIVVPWDEFERGLLDMFTHDGVCSTTAWSDHDVLDLWTKEIGFHDEWVRFQEVAVSIGDQPDHLSSDPLSRLRRGRCSSEAMEYLGRIPMKYLVFPGGEDFQLALVKYYRQLEQHRISLEKTNTTIQGG